VTVGEITSLPLRYSDLTRKNWERFNGTSWVKILFKKESFTVKGFFASTLEYFDPGRPVYYTVLLYL